MGTRDSMRLKTGLIFGAIIIVLLGGAAIVVPPKARTAAQVSKPQASSILRLPDKASNLVPNSVSASPNGRYLAVGTQNYTVFVMDLSTGRWVRTFHTLADLSEPLRWHPSEPVLICAGGSSCQPRYYKAFVANGKICPLYRGDPASFAWTSVGLINAWGVIDLARSGESGIRVRDLGHPIPWVVYHKNGSVFHIASGAHDEVAAEVGVQGKGVWVETYRKVPGRIQWVRAGRISPSKGEQTRAEGYAMNPAFLPDGEVTYLRTYRKSIAHEDGTISPGLYELWASSLDGKRLRRLAVLHDLHAYADWRADWYAVSWTRRTVYYLSGTTVRQMKF